VSLDCTVLSLSFSIGIATLGISEAVIAIAGDEGPTALQRERDKCDMELSNIKEELWNEEIKWTKAGDNLKVVYVFS